MIDKTPPRHLYSKLATASVLIVVNLNHTPRALEDLDLRSLSVPSQRDASQLSAVPLGCSMVSLSWTAVGSPPCVHVRSPYPAKAGSPYLPVLLMASIREPMMMLPNLAPTSKRLPNMQGK